ncbi:MAG: NifU family protein [Bacteroidota bacterium]|jgi:Fe-S cluster biogenesis protein NfuA|nr:NifU family protein [Sphingobacteriales bacterium]
MNEVNEFLDVYSESTPNPETMKFVFNKMILPDDSADFPTKGSTDMSPLAKNLFEFSFVNGVFIMNNFVTITRKEGIEWEEIIPITKEFLKSYVSAREPIIYKAASTAKTDFGADNDIVSKIQEILDTYVKPAVETDGGQIVFKDFENGIVTVELRGSCSGCPSSTITLKRGIEGMLTRMIPEVKEVVAQGA